MAEEKIKNLLIGLSNKNHNCYVETLDLNSNLNKMLISDFISGLNMDIEMNNENNIGFCFDCKKNINKNFTINHSIKYYKDITKNIDIQEIQNKFNNIVENYNNVINLLEQKIKNFKKRNDDQIALVKQIIEIYNSSLESNNLTYQLLLNVENILKFNEINKDKFFQENTPIDFDYNILKTFQIDKYFEEKISIETLKKISKINFKESIQSFLFLEKQKKILVYSFEKIYLLNSKNYAIESELNSNKEIISLNLLKDNETILVSNNKAIQKLKIENKKLVLEDYINYIEMRAPGIIINYGNGIAWAFGSIINFSNNEIYDVYEESEENYLEKKMDINIVHLFEYQKDIILYLFLFLNNGCGYNALHFNLYIENENKFKDIIIETEEYSSYTFEDSNIYRIYNCCKNEVLVVGLRKIYIINILDWKKVKSIDFPDSRINYNSYSLINGYFMFFLNSGNINLYRNEEYEKNNIIIMKIKEDYNKIICNYFLNTEKIGDLYFNTTNNELIGISQIIAIENNCMNFYEMKLTFQKTINLIMKNN